MNWWEKSFTKPYHDIFCRLFPEPTQEEVEKISTWFPVDSHSNVLDLACGDGRHSIGLTELGYNVTGVDISKDLLGLAREKSSSLQHAPTFLEQDMRALELARVFDLILLIGNSFGYSTDEDQQQVLKSVSKHLAPGGSFLIAMPNGLRSMCAFNHEDVIEQEFELDGEKVVVKEEYSFEPTTCIKKSVWSVKKSDQILYEQESSVRFYTVPEVVQMLSAVGLHPKVLYGGYDEQSYTKQSSSLLIIAQKN